MKRLLYLLAILTALLGLSIPVLAAGPTDQSVSQAPRIGARGHFDPSTSSNWAGYAAETNFSKPSNGVVNDVYAQWVVPTVIASNASNSYSSIWVGIDGFSDTTVEQVGTEQDWVNGQAHYSAWWETYPKNAMQTIGLTISPNDTITAEVKYMGNGQFRMSLGDVTSGQSFSTTQTLRSAKRQSAEWIVEAPFSGGILPLADFQNMTFTNASATFNNTMGSISNSNWQNTSITMVGQNGTVKAQPGDLLLGGTSFSVTWKNN